jgi:hypothetical protein
MNGWSGNLQAARRNMSFKVMNSIFFSNSCIYHPALWVDTKSRALRCQMQDAYIAGLLRSCQWEI